MVSKGLALEQRWDKVVLNQREYLRADLEVMFWQNRTESFEGKKEDKAMQLPKPAVSLSPSVAGTASVEEGIPQSGVKNDLSNSRSIELIEEGRAKKTRKKRLPDYQQKIHKLTAARRSDKKSLKL